MREPQPVRRVTEIPTFFFNRNIKSILFPRTGESSKTENFTKTMLFNSFSFGFFLLAVYMLYWIVFNRGQRLRNVFLLSASYFFYGCWDWRFLFLIAFVSTVDYLFGYWLHRTQAPRVRCWILAGALIINLGLLGFFKYFNFFIDSFAGLLSLFGLHTSSCTLNIVLPVGISFFTFQGLSYVLDIYYRKFEPTRDIVAFFTFISFFPQLVAGPIERAKDLLPQFADPVRRKAWDYESTRRGLFMIAVGLFKKMVIADRVAIYVDAAYADVSSIQGWPAVVAVLFFAVQLYLDFSAYSQIAIGTARLLGYRLSTNFNLPYLATSFKDFWARWHITLTCWFRDYLYFPLGGNRRGRGRTYLNVMIIFAVSGLWHGASWNFVIWGCLNGLALAFFDKVLHLNPKTTIACFASSIFVVGFWTFSLVFFRAQTFADAITMFRNLDLGNLETLYNYGLNAAELHFVSWLIVVLFAVELLLKKKGDQIENFFWGRFFIFRWICYMAIALSTIYFGVYGIGADSAFIYFQF